MTNEQKSTQKIAAPKPVIVADEQVVAAPVDDQAALLGVMRRLGDEQPRLRPADAALLQRTVGNRATGVLLGKRESAESIQNASSRSFEAITRRIHDLGIQAKLTVGAVDDPHEKEADAMAKQVVQRINRQEDDELEMKRTTGVQRQEEDELEMKRFDGVQRQEEDELELSRLDRAVAAPGDPMLDGGEVNGDIESGIRSAKGGGSPLADTVRKPMESAFNADFSGVKVHTDSQSDALNQSVSAKAFTTGQDVFFRQGAYVPGSQSGQELLAHELTHVVQQTGGAVKKSPAALDRKTDDSIVQRVITQNGQEVSAQEVMMQMRMKFGSNTNFMREYKSAITRYIDGGENITLEELMAQLDEEDEFEDDDMDVEAVLGVSGESKEMAGSGESETEGALAIRKLVVLRRQTKALRLGLQKKFGTDALAALTRGLLEVGITVGSAFLPIPGMGEFAGQLMNQGLTTSVAATGGQALGGSVASATAKLSEVAAEGPDADPFRRPVPQAESGEFEVSDKQAQQGTTTSGRAKQAFDESSFGTGGKVASTMMGATPKYLKPAMVPFAATGAVLGTAAHMVKDAAYSKTLKPIGLGSRGLVIKAASKLSQSAADYRAKEVAMEKGPVIEWLIHGNGMEALRAAAERYYAEADDSTVSVAKRKNLFAHRDAQAIAEKKKVDEELKKLYSVLQAKHAKHWQTYWQAKQAALGKEHKEQ